MEIWELAVFVLALSIDALIASFAYGASGIQIPFRCVLILNLICSGILGLAVLTGGLFKGILSESAAHGFSFGILFVLGVVKLFDGLLKHEIRKLQSKEKKIRFSVFHFQFLLTVYADPKEADADRSHSLSVKECCSLATALSLDGLAAGFGAALAENGLIWIVVCNLMFGILAVLAGSFLGKRMAIYADWDCSWLGGVLLLVLAFFRL